MGNMATTYTRLILLLIESGFVIAAAKVTEFVLFEVAGSGIGGNNAMYIPFDIMPQITVSGYQTEIFWLTYSRRD